MEILLTVIGGILTLTIAFFVEAQKKPKVQISIESPPRVIRCTGNPVNIGKWVRVNVTNIRPRFPLVVRQNAVCRASVAFMDHTGQRIFVDEMAGRWANTPEPIQTIFRDGQAQTVYDLNIVYPYRCIEIAPGEVEPLDIAAKFDNDSECYGWNNESHIHNWRNRNFVLNSGWYIVQITIYYSGFTYVKRFRIINTGGFDDFRLEEAHVEDY